MTRLHPDDIKALAAEIVQQLRLPAPPSAVVPSGSIQDIQRQALELARQGRRAESIELQRSIAKRRAA